MPVSEEEVEAAAAILYEFEEMPDDIVPWKLQQLMPLGLHYKRMARAALEAAAKVREEQRLRETSASGIQ